MWEDAKIFAKKAEIIHIIIANNYRKIVIVDLICFLLKTLRCQHVTEGEKVKKYIKLATSIVLTLMLLISNIVTVFAAPVISESQETKFVSEGYTEDGAHYTINEITTFVSSVGTPRIVVSKELQMNVEFFDHIIPPSTYAYSGYDYGYNTQMTGTLNLIAYSHDGIIQKVTKATYKGTVFGNI